MKKKHWTCTVPTMRLKRYTYNFFCYLSHPVGKCMALPLIMKLPWPNFGPSFIIGNEKSL